MIWKIGCFATAFDIKKHTHLITIHLVVKRKFLTTYGSVVLECKVETTDSNALSSRSNRFHYSSNLALKLNAVKGWKKWVKHDVCCSFKIKNFRPCVSKFLDFWIHGESFISRLPLSSDGLLSCSCVQSNPRSLLQSNSRLLCHSVSVFTHDFKKKHWWQYPGCQRLFIRGFRFWLSLKKVIRANFFSRLRRSCHRPAADHIPRRIREKTSGAQSMMTRISFAFFNVSSLFTK